MDYNSLNDLNNSDKSTLSSIFSGILTSVKHISVNKVSSIIRYIPDMCRLHHNSRENRKLRSTHPQKYHPVKPKRGDIFNAYITEGIGSELSGNHLVLIVQNKKGNIYSEKVNVLPIEGDGNNINPNYQMALTNSDLSEGHLDKDPSRVIITDIMTLDKARLDIKVGTVTPEYMIKISDLLRKQLSL